MDSRNSWFFQHFQYFKLFRFAAAKAFEFGSIPA